MSKALLDWVVAEFSADVLGTHAQHGDETVVLRPEAWFKVHQFLREDARASIDMLVDLTAVDYPDREPRFEIVSHLMSLSKGHRLRLKTQVGDAEGELAEVGSLTALWASANWLERECYDMFGVRFVGHPDLRRILLYPEFEGHPLRKDYPADKIQPLVPFREVSGIEKVAPFGPDEGMSFGRQTHDRHRDDN
ncbi:MAG TPA: NADH-quinone oxidoreductase subunit C [Polyangiaceae bacterium]|nr:NADH-quinone oxidoreductase subunit C [Polyangiaceae bacterium]